MASRMKIAFLMATVMMSQVSAQEAPAESGANVKDIGFRYEKDKSRLEIELDGTPTFEKHASPGDKQVIIDIKGAKISKKWARRLDTSQYPTDVSLISPYQSGDIVRVVLQMKEGNDIEVSQEGNKLVAYIDNRQAAGEAPPPDLTQQPAEGSEPDAAKEIVNSNASDAPAIAETTNPPPAAIENVSAPSNAESNPEALETFFNSQRTKSYSGKRISIQLREADLADVFRIVSEASEFNIVLSDVVKGKVTINLNDVPWDQALDLLLHSYKLAAERRDNVLRITTLEGLTKEKEVEVAARKASEAAEPLVVKIFPLSFTKPIDMMKIINGFLAGETDTQGAASGTPGFVPQSSQGRSNNSNQQNRGSIQADERTNSLIVRNTPEALEKIKRVIKELDIPVPQILIEAKFVSVSETDAKSVQGRLFSSSRESSSTGTLSFNNGKNNYGALFGGNNTGDLPTGFALTPLTVGGASFGFSPKSNLLPGIGEIGAFLAILESETQAKVVASPRLVVQNKESANITQGSTTYVVVGGGVGTGGNLQKIEAKLSLKVKPQVTNDGSIMMEVDFTNDTPAGELAVNNNGMNTKVLVDSGGTLVIGGIYQKSESTSESGIPILRNLPIIGAFFGSKSKSNAKSEVFIFLTPRVINDREHGLRG